MKVIFLFVFLQLVFISSCESVSMQGSEYAVMLRKKRWTKDSGLKKIMLVNGLHSTSWNTVAKSLE